MGLRRRRLSDSLMWLATASSHWLVRMARREAQDNSSCRFLCLLATGYLSPLQARPCRGPVTTHEAVGPNTRVAPSGLTSEVAFSCATVARRRAVPLARTKPALDRTARRRTPPVITDA
jgi:hypothetical protein